MNKKMIILSVMFLFFGMLSGLHAATERPLGSVVAVEREMTTDLDACAAKFEKTNSLGERGDSYMRIQCEVDLFPNNDQDQEVSSSIYKAPDADLRTVLIKDKNGYDVNLYIDSTHKGYRVATSQWNLEYLPELKDVTKEDFVKASKILIDRFPKFTVKVYKVVQ